MIDIKNIREQQSLIQDRLTKRDKSISLDSIVSADLSLRELTKNLMIYNLIKINNQKKLVS